MHGYLRHLANFVEIARSGSLGAASGRLNTSVSGLSRSLAILEAHYGFPLMVRTARGMDLTELGRQVLAEAQALVGAAHRALEVGRSPAAIAGTVVFSAPKEVLQFWLPEAIAEILQAHPGLDLKLLAADQIIDSRRERVDVVVRIARRGMASDLDILFEADVTPVLVAAPSITRQLEPGGNGSLPAAFLRFGPFGQDGTLTLPNLRPDAPSLPISFAQQVIVSDVAVAIELARAGAGVVGCLEPSVRGDLHTGRLVPAFPQYGFGPASMCLGLTKGHHSHAAVAFANALTVALRHWMDGV